MSQDENQNYQQNSCGAPPRSQPVEPKTSDSPSQQEHKSSEPSWTGPKITELIFSLALVMFTGALVWVSSGQWGAMQDQLKEMKGTSEQTKRAIEASEKANLLRESGDRAYVFVMPGILYHVHGNGLPQSYTVLSNSGLTVAKNVVSSVGIRLLRLPGADVIDDLGSMRIPEEGIMVAHPRVPHVLIRELKRRQGLTPKEIEEIRTGAKRVYVFGLVTYEDIYGRSHKHEFCFMYFGREYMDNPQRGDGYYDTQAKYCKEHNKDD